MKKTIDPLSSTYLLELYWFFVQEHRDLYEEWKKEFLSDPPADYFGPRIKREPAP